MRLSERELGRIRIDGERHVCVWVASADRRVSAVVDRPLEGALGPSVLAVLGAEEAYEQARAVFVDYCARDGGLPPSERLGARALRPDDLVAPAEGERRRAA
jgi:hypothetical protein